MWPLNVRIFPRSHLSFDPPPFKVPHLGLHAAAATGNIGLAKYAISHGQPINSVIDGVLPLHAACSGGSDMVVRLLIDNGADVNAPRSVFRTFRLPPPLFFILELPRSWKFPLHHAFATTLSASSVSAPPSLDKTSMELQC